MQKVEPIVLNRLASGPVNVLGTTRSTLLVGQRAQLLALAKSVTRPAAPFQAPNPQPRVLDIARCRSRESGRK